ncbi:MAG: hypothetical protein ACJ8AK_12875 [Gemmatimonadaceae bacterium]
MSGRHWLWGFALLAVGGSVACSDSTGPSGPTSPLQKKASLTAPTGAAFGRYILISGVVTCEEDCDDSGPGEKVEGIPNSSPDPLDAFPADTVQILPDSTGS